MRECITSRPPDPLRGGKTPARVCFIKNSFTMAKTIFFGLKAERISARCVELTETERKTGYMARFKNLDTGSTEVSRLFYRDGEIQVDDELDLYRWSAQIVPVRLDRNGTLRTYRTISGLSKSESDIEADATRSATYFYDNAVEVDRGQLAFAKATSCFADFVSRADFLQELGEFE